MRHTKTSDPTDIIRKRIRKWLLADDMQPPLLLCGSNPDMLREISEYAARLAGPRDCRTLSSQTKSLPIKEIRSLILAASYTPWETTQLFVIPQAERLTVPAAHALLKTLEESGDSIRFLLTTRWRRRVLPTILSRCAVITLSSVQSIGSEQPASLLLDARSALRRLALAQAGVISADELAAIESRLQHMTRSAGPTPALRRAFMRLRDYYRIVSQTGANERFALDVLAASLPDDTE